MPRLVTAGLRWALLGATSAVVLVSLDFASKSWIWWLSEHRSALQQLAIVLWPSSIMMMATEGWSTWWVIIALLLSVSVNAITYALFGMLLHLLYAGAKRARKWSH